MAQEAKPIYAQPPIVAEPITIGPTSHEPPMPHGTPVPITHPPHLPPPINEFTVTGTTVAPASPFSSLGTALTFVGQHFPAAGGAVTIAYAQRRSE